LDVFCSNVFECSTVRSLAIAKIAGNHAFFGQEVHVSLFPVSPFPGRHYLCPTFAATEFLGIGSPNR
jgi:hypothetical protein